MKNETSITSQNKKIIAYMQKGRRVNALMSWIRFGCGALHSRISDIRNKMGIEVKDEWITVKTSFGEKRVKEYWIEKQLA